MKQRQNTRQNTSNPEVSSQNKLNMAIVGILISKNDAQSSLILGGLLPEISFRMEIDLLLLLIRKYTIYYITKAKIVGIVIHRAVSYLGCLVNLRYNHCPSSRRMLL
jgi:hypothetical protein